ncbi:hypothetical protein CHS0354_002255 [Potamilus streckersoni]|uniref:Uncharacterized protein n=1 Tax=Potamilus streckersoni TaxID=2493646 RepID=A0AAE0WDM5_9BIVA|nr:hypothetical protein CHS0354_002255 [Potamilus streckersoni]
MAVANIHTSNKLLVVSIDFGTTYSGYAFSFKAEYEQNRMKIFTKHWKPDGYAKTPTVLLLDSQQRFVAFGFDAENKYAELADDNAHNGYYYFHHFKMALHANTKLSRKEDIEDCQGKHVRASVVFMHSIRYLKEMAEKDLKDRGIRIIENEIRWILTVPAIWNDAAKQFMREAAADAGIAHNVLRLALEPESASIYCKELIVNREEGSQSSELVALREGSKFMVVDMGGGTVDVTVRKVVKGRKLKELFVATGGPWGGSKVNENFMVFMGNLLGQEVWDKFCSEYMSDKLEIERDFEKKKRYVEIGSDNRILIKLPLAVRDILKELTKKDLNNVLAIEGGFQGKVEMKKDKLKLDPKLVQSFFDDSLKSIIRHLKKLLKSIDIDTLFLVGGFAESPLVCETIQQTFPDKRIVVHDDAGLCVLKGAVLYGHDPSIVTARVCKFTYGTEAMRYFIKGYDPEDQKVTVDGQSFCKIFVKHAEIGQTVSIEETSTCELEAVSATMTVMTIPVFVSEEQNPVYTSYPSCQLLGKVKVDITDLSGGINRKVIVNFTFGESELMVEAVNAQSGDKVYATFDLLDDKGQENINRDNVYEEGIPS